MRRVAFRVLACALAGTAIGIAQSPAFDVASVKVNHSGGMNTRIVAPRGTGRLDVTNAMVHTLILNAYALQDFQLAGGPSWISNMRFDIAARTTVTATDLADRADAVRHHDDAELAQCRKHADDAAGHDAQRHGRPYGERRNGAEGAVRPSDHLCPRYQRGACPDRIAYPTA